MTASVWPMGSMDPLFVGCLFGLLALGCVFVDRVLIVLVSGFLLSVVVIDAWFCG